MFNVNGNVTKIDGSKGKYDDKVTNQSVKYGRNAVENFYTYMENPIINDKDVPAPILDFGVSKDAVEKNEEKLNSFVQENDKYLNSLPPLEFEYRYMPNMNKGEIDKQAILGAAYEAMGQSTELPVSEVDNRFAPNKDFTSQALDVNKDGKIDIAEYGSSLLAADMLSKDENANPENIDGTINSKGFNTVLAYAHKSNAAAAANLYSKIGSTYNLQEAKSEFNPE